ncbi:hypothetical protein JTE90_018226 [Oedothorax gibbosus]|uniref:THAP-type domain-containing protein n=1 Tax=Oedothorax gibbosus TaxID=931172 RepID=A0AAV6U9T0_9ARAC|nr:hypothetical protein JTE90_018226 [Oedothorax gibbosus]
MVSSCCAFGCTKRYKKGDNIGFFRFPLKNKSRLDKWLKALRRTNWTPTSASKICGQHFQSGKPNSDENHPDFVPNIFMFAKPSTSLMSFNRRQKVLKKRSVIAETSVIQEDRTEAENDAADALLLFPSKVCEQEQPLSDKELIKKLYREIDYLRDEVKDLKQQVELLKNEEDPGVDMLSSPKKVSFYTGLPSSELFQIVDLRSKICLRNVERNLLCRHLQEGKNNCPNLRFCSPLEYRMFEFTWKE